MYNNYNQTPNTFTKPKCKQISSNQLFIYVSISSRNRICTIWQRNCQIIRYKEIRKLQPSKNLEGCNKLDVIYNYSMIVATRPEPTVRPPSRIANVRPCSIAIGWISSIVISTLSPGIHISVPSGKLHTPVTSVVLK